MAAVQAVSGKTDAADIVNDEKVRAAIREKFAAFNKTQSGSSSRIRRVILMAEPPSVDGHEITDKGYVNQRATMDRRRPLVDKLFVPNPDPEVIEIP
jgi:feruloyl-CoA synthase